MEKHTMIVSVCINGVKLKGPGYLDAMSYKGVMNITNDGLSILKKDSGGSNCLVCSLKYDEIDAVELHVVRRAGGANWTAPLYSIYNYEIVVHTGNDEWKLECDAQYRLNDALLNIVSKQTKVIDAAGILEHFKDFEEFHGMSEKEYDNLSTNQPLRRDIKANDFQKYCDEHYMEWADKFGFDKLRMEID
jgi:hypothetical protein